MRPVQRARTRDADGMHPGYGGGGGPYGTHGGYGGYGGYGTYGGYTYDPYSSYVPYARPPPPPRPPPPAPPRPQDVGSSRSRKDGRRDYEGPPGPDYFCNRCKVGGHWIHDCPMIHKKPRIDHGSGSSGGGSFGSRSGPTGPPPQRASSSYHGGMQQPPPPPPPPPPPHASGSQRPPTGGRDRGDATAGSRAAAERLAARTPDQFGTLTRIAADLRIDVGVEHLDCPEAIAGCIETLLREVDGNRTVKCLHIVGDDHVANAIATDTATEFCLDWAAVALASLSAHCETLVSLTLEQIPLHGPSPLASVGTLKRLQALRIRNCTSLVPSSLASLEACTDLHLVDLSDCPVEDFALGYFAGAQSLQTIVIDRTGCTDVSLVQTCMFSNLWRLSAAGNKGITDQGGLLVARRLPLTHLRLAGCVHLTEKTVEALRDYDRTLQRVDFSNCNLDQACASIGVWSNGRIYAYAEDEEFTPPPPMYNRAVVPRVNADEHDAAATAAATAAAVAAVQAAAQTAAQAMQAAAQAMPATASAAERYRAGITGMLRAHASEEELRARALASASAPTPMATDREAAEAATEDFWTKASQKLAA